MTLAEDQGASTPRAGLSDAAMAAALRSLLFGGELTPPRSGPDRDHAARRRIATRQTRRVA